MVLLSRVIPSSMKVFRVTPSLLLHKFYAPPFHHNEWPLLPLEIYHPTYSNLSFMCCLNFPTTELNLRDLECLFDAIASFFLDELDILGAIIAFSILVELQYGQLISSLPLLSHHNRKSSKTMPRIHVLQNK